MERDLLTACSYNNLAKSSITKFMRVTGRMKMLTTTTTRAALAQQVLNKFLNTRLESRLDTRCAALRRSQLNEAKLKEQKHKKKEREMKYLTLRTGNEMVAV